MIVAQISAGIGNQLFQYATSRSLSLRTGSPLRLDLAYYRVRPNRAYRLGAYDLEAREASDRELEPFLSPLHRRRFVRGAVFAGNRMLPFQRRRIVIEPPPHLARFDSRLLHLNAPVYLAGFWQCERYFADHAAIIRNELTLRTPVPACYQEALGMIDSCDSVGLVVRRGDYLGIANTQGICTLDYYRMALEHVTKLLPNRRVFVFSDDIPWCREHLAWESSTVFVPNETLDCPEEHLRILSRCRHFIVANSSFAWWGAWLGTSAEKLVLAPPVWMRQARGFEDMIPSSWIRIQSALAD